MDGRRRWLGNVLIEGPWRSLKHEDVYLKGYADGCEANTSPSTTSAAFTRRSAIARRSPFGAKARARTATGDERARLWKKALVFLPA